MHFELFSNFQLRRLEDSLPVLVNSVFGWVVSGKTYISSTTSTVASHTAHIEELHDSLEKFWTIEEGTCTTNFSVEEAECEDHFIKNIRRTIEGRYIVRLPIKEHVLLRLSHNRNTAVRRFRMLENRFSRNSDLHDQYEAFINEYHVLDLQTMRCRGVSSSSTRI